MSNVPILASSFPSYPTDRTETLGRYFFKLSINIPFTNTTNSTIQVIVFHPFYLIRKIFIHISIYCLHHSHSYTQKINMHRGNATQIIQKQYRAYQEQRLKSVQTIQKQYRGHQVYQAYRTKLNQLKQGLYQEQRIQSAQTIQKLFQHHRVKMCYAELVDSETLSKDFQRELKNGTLTKALGGKTAVYLWAQKKVAFKRCDAANAALRIKKKKLVQAVINKLNLKHLIVPAAKTCAPVELLAEKMLPISGSLVHNMKIYVDHHETFDMAVREMVRLYSKISIGDLVTCMTKSIHQTIGKTARIIRYDNITLFKKNKKGYKGCKGYIGLVDLEEAQNHSGTLTDLATIFPYHVKIIIEEAKKLKGSFEEQTIREAGKKGSAFIENVFITHHNWIQEHPKINPDALIQLPSEVKKELALTLQEKLKEIHTQKRGLSQKGEFEKDSFSSGANNPFYCHIDTEKVQDSNFIQAFIDAILEDLNKDLNFNWKEKCSDSNDLHFTDSDRMQLRTVSLDFNYQIYDKDLALPHYAMLQKLTTLKSKNCSSHRTFRIHLLSLMKLSYYLLFSKLQKKSLILDFFPRGGETSMYATDYDWYIRI